MPIIFAGHHVPANIDFLYNFENKEVLRESLLTQGTNGIC
jgi:hypothetical protein